jgi:hypothetical protein
VELLRALAPDGAAFPRLALWSDQTILVVADIWWHPLRGTARLSMAYLTGTTWQNVYEEPAGQLASVGREPVAWVDLSFDPTTRRLTLAFSPEGGVAAIRTSAPVPDEIMSRFTRVALSCIRSEFLFTDVLLTRNYTGPTTKRPTLYTRQLPSGDVVLFWAGEPGVRYQLDRTRDFTGWTEVADFIGSNSGELLELEIPEAASHNSFFRLFAR